MHASEELFAKIVTGGPGTGKSTVIKCMHARINGIYSDTNETHPTSLCMGKRGTADFVIDGVTYNSIFYLLVHIPFTPLLICLASH